MALTTEFKPLALDQLRREAAVLKADGWRFIQTHAVYTENGIDLYYSFMKDGYALNYWIQGVQKGTPVPSITDLFLAAFVFENEARELFGVDMRDIALDFGGAMYAPAINEPMTIISPEQKAAREKARKAAEKAAGTAAGEAGSDKGAAQKAASPSSKRVFVMTPERQARLNAKLPTLSEEKRAKVEAALKARAAEAKAASQAPAENAVAEQEKKAKPATSDAVASQGTPVETDGSADAVLAQTIASLDADKAAKVRAALGLESASNAEGPAGEKAAPNEPASTEALVDEQVKLLVNTMDDAKAARVRAALTAKGGE